MPFLDYRAVEAALAIELKVNSIMDGQNMFLELLVPNTFLKKSLGDGQNWALRPQINIG